eukprot:TRINITY_DN1438_c0_g1::TRINITY_DN1438_c0_g1_i1::g.27141::m.27141 TRINITY_DN1438_c0_g1::TRINITY_DN1438_c0_g1_i1::g.27141  ORF type:complete len:128 (+),score=41.49,sp/Q90YT3/RL35A_ICTPU/56.36/1e-38,Ribosomal_L35Ae/PF01247.13/3.2e-40 TRINITY_DN1438_c0_g1_i1:46-384(+)
MVQPVRLYSKGVFLGFKRGKRNQTNHTSLIRIEGVNTTKDAEFYLGKRIAYVYKAQREKKGVRGQVSKYRVIWGKANRVHGSNGVVRAKFAKNLPPKAIGGPVRVFMYPSRV